MASHTPSNSTTEYKARIVADYILVQFRMPREDGPGSTIHHGTRPLMVSMQGPQGAGRFLRDTTAFQDLIRQAKVPWQKL